VECLEKSLKGHNNEDDRENLFVPVKVILLYETRKKEKQWTTRRTKPCKRKKSYKFVLAPWRERTR
jgi:hypothetical protein